MNGPILCLLNPILLALFINNIYECLKDGVNINGTVFSLLDI